MSDPELMHLFGFDAEDLAANRRGEMTPKQVAQIRRDETATNYIFGGFAGVCLIGAGVLSSRLWSEGTLFDPTAFNEAGPSWLGIVILLVAAGLLIYAVINKLNTAVGVVTGKGKLMRDVRQSGGAVPRQIVFYGLVIDRHTFMIPQAAYEQLADGEVYTVYFTKGMRRVLSVERV